MSKLITVLNACEEGSEYAESQDSYKSAWSNCKRGDWMLWIARKRKVDIKKLIKAKVECTKLVEHLMVERSINALRVAERLSEGMATRVELDAAAVYANAVYANATAVVATTATNKKDILSRSADTCRKYISYEDLRMDEL